MTEIDLLGYALNQFAGMDEEAFALSIPYWQKKHYRKGEFYNEYKNVCFNAIPLYHISSYLGIQGPSLSRIRKRMVGR